MVRSVAEDGGQPSLESLESLESLLESEPLSLESELALSDDWLSPKLALGEGESERFGAGLFSTELSDSTAAAPGAPLLEDGDGTVWSDPRDFATATPPMARTATAIAAMRGSIFMSVPFALDRTAFDSQRLTRPEGYAMCDQMAAGHGTISPELTRLEHA